MWQGNKNSLKGLTHRFLKGNIPWNRNKKGIHLSSKSEFKKGQTVWNKGNRIQTNTGKTHFKKGHIPWNNGEKRPEMTGEKHWNWKGGTSFEPYPVDWTDDLKESIRKRDDFICQLCGIHQDELKEKLHCHHIDYDKDNLDPKNLISLCRSCHIKTNYNREYWMEYLVKIK